MAATTNAIFQANDGYSPVPRVPAASYPTTITYEQLPSGAAGTFRALEVMAQCVRGEAPPDYSGYRDEYNRRQAIAICSAVSGQDEHGEISAIFAFVSRRLRYVPHPLNQQRVQDCRRTIECGSGDCVSKSVCLATLLAALGYLCRFVAQAPNGLDYSHVYCEVQLDDGQWLALDPVAESEPMGWRQPLPNGGFETTQMIFW